MSAGALDVPLTEIPPTPAEMPAPARGLFAPVGDAFEALGDWSVFSARAISGIWSPHLKARELLRICVEVGVGSVAVVGVTGLFIGMVLAVQTYSQFQTIGLETSLGAIIHMSVVRELGPVLAAVMLSGRVGTAMAAQLGTMRVTEQIDAIACLGVDPVKYLVGPRVLACVLMIPLLTVIADAMGVVGSTGICLYVYRIESDHYWQHTASFVKSFDLLMGLAKSLVFGAVLGLICCHRGFHCKPGAEGVGKAATEGFVLSFVAIMFLDFVMAMLTTTLYNLIWPAVGAKVA